MIRSPMPAFFHSTSVLDAGRTAHASPARVGFDLVVGDLLLVGFRFRGSTSLGWRRWEPAANPAPGARIPLETVRSRPPRATPASEDSLGVAVP